MLYVVMVATMKRLFMAKATFAAGCYWGVEAEFRLTLGLVRAVAVVTEVREDRADVAVELDFCG